MSQIDTLSENIRRSCGEKKSLALSDLMALLQDRRIRIDVLCACQNLCKKRAVLGEDLKSYAQALLTLWDELFQQAKPRQQSADKLEWMLDEEYSGIRSSAESLLDVMGYVPGDAVSNRLREALALTDPKLKVFAAVSLLRRLEPVDPDEMERIAASNEVRIVLWEQLRELRMESLMPQRWSTPELIAASELSRWVSDPLELGVPPEEVELVKTFRVEVDGRDHDAYLFRFREFPKPWELGEGWMAGIAGPYHEGQVIGSCWSAFERWDSRSPEEHFSALYGSVNRCE